MSSKWLVHFVLIFSASLNFAQTPWPSVQSKIYPVAQGMMLVRHEQSVLLGEGALQTGLFFATSANAFSERVHNELREDAVKKGWTLHSIMRSGTSYLMSFSQGSRVLDIRLTNTPAGVDAVYSVVPNQQPPKVVAKGNTVKSEPTAASVVAPAIVPALAPAAAPASAAN